MSEREHLAGQKQGAARDLFNLDASLFEERFDLIDPLKADRQLGVNDRVCDKTGGEPPPLDLPQRP